MNKFNNKRKRHGPWEGHHINGNLMYKENYINGKKHGLIEFYWDNGNLNIKQYYL